MQEHNMLQAEAAAARAERRYRDDLAARYIRAFGVGDFAAMSQVFQEAEGDLELELLLFETAEELADDDIVEVKLSVDLQARLHAAVVQLRLLLRRGPASSEEQGLEQ